MRMCQCRPCQPTQLAVSLYSFQTTAFSLRFCAFKYTKHGLKQVGGCSTCTVLFLTSSSQTSTLCAPFVPERHVLQNAAAMASPVVPGSMQVLTLCARWGQTRDFVASERHVLVMLILMVIVISMPLCKFFGRKQPIKTAAYSMTLCANMHWHGIVLLRPILWSGPEVHQVSLEGTAGRDM